MELTQHHKTVLEEALGTLERCGDDAYLEILDDDDLRKALDDLKDLCCLHDTHDNTNIANKTCEDPERIDYDYMSVTVRKPTEVEILKAKIDNGYNVCLDCIPKGWYDPKTHICTYSACDECDYEIGQCDGVCNPPECTHGYDVMPDEWNPEVRIKIWTSKGEKVVKVDGSDANADEIDG